MNKLLLLFIFLISFVACKKIEPKPTVPIKDEEAKISSLNSDSNIRPIFNRFLTNGEPLYKFKVKIPYTGGNGKIYKSTSHASSGINGLIAILEADTLNIGEGYLTYIISGTPDYTSTEEYTTFRITFGEYGTYIFIDKLELSQFVGIPNGKINDIEGNSYKTVTIGNQTWMAENLRTSKYNDGSSIAHIVDSDLWYNDTIGAWCYYNHDSTNDAIQGKLYNWYTVNPQTNGNKNICPSGWHVPSIDEWKELTNYLGGDKIAGGKMREVDNSNRRPYPYGYTLFSNASLFTAIQAGIAYSSQKFEDENTINWWSSTEFDKNKAKVFSILNDYSYNLDFFKNDGYSIRCIKD
jgi:uncharacterized protein (TIGR02145 family)